MGPTIPLLMLLEPAVRPVWWYQPRLLSRKSEVQSPPTPFSQREQVLTLPRHLTHSKIRIIFQHFSVVWLSTSVSFFVQVPRQTSVTGAMGGGELTQTAQETFDSHPMRCTQDNIWHWSGGSKAKQSVNIHLSKSGMRSGSC